jgi:transposase
MLTRGEDVEAHALKKRGWTISAISRHTGRDRKTVRSYLNGERVPGVRARPDTSDPFADYEKYISARFVDDHHVWGTVLFAEVGALGYAQTIRRSWRQIRKRDLRPHCEACSGVVGRDTIEIDHPAGDEIQWDWFERRQAPWGGTAYVLLGTLPHSSRTRGVLAESMDQAHLIESMDGVLRRLGGTPHTWRTDRLDTVIRPGMRDVQASFAPVAEYYGAVVEPCPPRRGNRKGAVEAAVRFTSGRWWRTLSATSPEEAQLSLDRFLAGPGDARQRRTALGVKTTVGELADAEPLLDLPALPFPATVTVERPVDANATVAFRGNRYSVLPGLSGITVELRHRLSSATLEIVAASGSLLATHRLAPAGARTIVRTPEHRSALESVILSSFTTARPCDTKANRPPGPDSLAEAARLLGTEGHEVTVDLQAYADLIEGTA